MEHLHSERAVHVGMRSTGTDVTISVTDRGAGFPDADRAFEAFFTTKANGMGMGLTICKSIVEAHGGRLQVTPSQDVGTTVGFSIPTVPEHEGARLL